MKTNYIATLAKLHKWSKTMNAPEHYIPLDVSSPLRACKNVDSPPLWIDRSEGEYLIDQDGNKYIDFMYAFGPLILGYNHPEICKAIKAQVDKGILFGTASKIEHKLASLIVHSTESIERIRFVNSGTEAVMSAVRLARAYTRRTKVMTFIGGYHGHSDLFIKGEPVSAGLDPAIRNAVSQCEYNNLDRIEKQLVSQEFSCVIIEPIACNMSLILPEDNFLSELRRLCDKTKTVLIFDEVISGFRFGFGSVANQLGIHADLYTFGKIIGGGTPIGALAGSKCYFNLLAMEQVLQGGTFSGNPLSMAAGVATLEILQDIKIYQSLDKKGLYLDKLHRDSSFLTRLQLVRFHSTFSFQFRSTPARNYQEASSTGYDEYGYIYRACRNAGIHLTPDLLEPIHLSVATSEASIKKLISTVELALNEFDQSHQRSKLTTTSQNRELSTSS